MEVQPTRMNLINLAKRCKLAEKGLSLLEMKRNALMTEFFSQLDVAREVGEELNEMLQMGYTDLATAQMIHGIIDLKALSLGAGPLRKVDIETKNIMGVVVPSISSVYEVEVSMTDVIHGSTPLDRVRRDFEKLSDILLKYGEISETLRRLSNEINKTKRKTKALENIVIPRLILQQKLIRMHFEEMEREDFFRLKMVKRKKMKR